MSETQPETVSEGHQEAVKEPVKEPTQEPIQEPAREEPKETQQEGQSEPMEVDQETNQPEVDEGALEADIAATDAELKEFFPQLPVSKVKKIARSDPEHLLTSNNAFVATAFATEIFVKAVTEEMLAQSQLSGKNNKDSKTLRLTYNDMAECVAKKDQFRFLEDVVPRTKNLRSLVKQNRVRYTTASSYANPLAKGQTQLPFSKQDIDKSNESQRPVDVENEKADDEEEEQDDDDEMEDNEEEMRAAERDQDEEVQKQMQEIEQMNQVADLDRDDSQAEQTDQEE